MSNAQVDFQVGHVESTIDLAQDFLYPIEIIPNNYKQEDKMIFLIDFLPVRSY